jgi:hypothetical protein
MEYPQDSITQQQWDDLNKVAQENVCSMCGGELQVHTVPEKKTITVGCLDRSHSGFTERESYTQAFRRGAILPEIIEAHIKKRMMPEDITRTMNLVMVKYPDALQDPPTAALFVLDCLRLGLDPLISPPEVVPTVFNKRQKDGTYRPVVVEIITEDGYLSGAARSDPQEWDGPPSAMPLQDYLMTLPHLKDRPLDEIEKIARRQAKDICTDENAWVWVALGKRKSATEATAPAYGWYTNKEQKEDADKKLVAGSLPGNQARIRAVKRWTRENFPEWRQKMIDMTSEWLSRAEGVRTAEKLVDAEYKVLPRPQSGEKTGEPTKKTTGKSKPAQTVVTPPKGAAKKSADVPPDRVACACPKPVPEDEVYSQEDGSCWHVACTGYLCTPPIDCFPGCPHIPLNPEEPPAEAAITGEGFSINKKWLDDSMAKLKWPEATMLTFLAAEPYKVTGKTVAEALAKLTRQLAETFTKEVNRRLEHKQATLM